uniref:Glycosyltransferase RgtA/B/C/D-like domain-containing protein n=1 Tax=Candidatus Kentrum sp. FW TaxID=2126338 RepID=A0A450TCP0_9GAMM|nr:MAG: hypothetical protein BECKFW1821C_GA0114237_100626 [Candidatus Kentron sp. FW]
MAHRIALGMIAIFSLIGVYLGRKNQLYHYAPIACWLGRLLGYLRSYAWIGIVLLLILVAIEDAFIREEITFLTTIKAFKLTYIAAGILILWSLSTITGRVSPLVQRTLWIVFLIYCLYLLLPSLVVIPPSHVRLDLELFSFIYERTHTVAIYPTLLFDQEGMRAFEDFLPRYGVLMPTLTAIGQQLFGAFSFGDFLHIVQLTQIVFFLMMFAALRIWLAGRPLALAGMMFLMLPWFGSFAWATVSPNASSWRYLGLAIAPLLLLSMRRLPMGWAVAITLGFGSGIMLLISMELGLCLSVGMLAYLTVRMEPFSWIRLVRSITLFLAGLLAAGGFYVLLFRAGLGYWPSMPPFETLFLSIVHHSSGITGLLFRWDPLAIVIFIHATFIVIRSAMAWRMRTLPFKQAFKLAMSIIILSWFAYYANFPFEKTRWTFIVPYLFIIPGYVNLEHIKRLRQRWKLRQWHAIPTYALVLILILVPMALQNNLRAVKKVANGLSISTQLSNTGIETVSGIWLAEEVASRLKEKAAYVRATAASEDSLMFTPNFFMVSLLSGQIFEYPPFEFFYFIIQPKDLDKAIHEILTRAPKRILFDSDVLYPDNPERKSNMGYAESDMKAAFVFREQALLHRLQNRLKDYYHPTAIVSGWEIWERYEP